MQLYVCTGSHLYILCKIWQGFNVRHLCFIFICILLVVFCPVWSCIICPADSLPVQSWERCLRKFCWCSTNFGWTSHFLELIFQFLVSMTSYLYNSFQIPVFIFVLSFTWPKWINCWGNGSLMCSVCGHHAGMTFLGLPQNGSHFMVVQNTMTTTTMLADRARATLLRCSPTVITSMELTRFFYIWFCFVCWIFVSTQAWLCYILIMLLDLPK